MTQAEKHVRKYYNNYPDLIESFMDDKIFSFFIKSKSIGHGFIFNDGSILDIHRGWDHGDLVPYDKYKKLGIVTYSIRGSEIYIRFNGCYNYQQKKAIKDIFLENEDKKIIFDNWDGKKLIKHGVVYDWYNFTKQTNNINEKKTMRTFRQFLNEANEKVILTMDNGFEWVDLQTNFSREEGEQMYHNGRANNDETLLSLRKNGRPHVTASYNSQTNSISMVAGKMNKPPVARYQPYVEELYKELNIKTPYDGTSITQGETSDDEMSMIGL